MILFYIIFGAILSFGYFLSNFYILVSLSIYFSRVLSVIFGLYLCWQITNAIWRLKCVPKKCVDPKGKAVLITGCDTGFGHLLTHKLVHYGFHVFAGCLFPSGEGGKKLKQELGGKVDVIQLDVTKDDSVRQARILVEEKLKQKGLGLWSLVNNAGILISTEIEFGDMSPFISQMEVNCLGMVRVSKAFIPLLRKSISGHDQNQARIINMASLAGRFSIPGCVSYCMSKCAVISFSDGLRREMKKWNIDVVTIEPHLFRTNLVAQAHETLVKEWQKTPEDVKTDYGQDYFKGFQDLLDKAIFSARSGVDKVVDTMFGCVTEVSVSPYHRVLGNFERLRVWMFEWVWPVRALDWVGHAGAVWITGWPKKVKDQVERQIKNNSNRSKIK